MDFIIRSESPGDESSIYEITRQAFASHPHSHQTEHFIIAALRKGKAMTLSLVAQIGDKVVGHIAFSPVEISDNTPGWFGLGPIAVSPEHQRKGIGSELVRAGLDRLIKLGTRGCVLAGDPAFYGRFVFGFTRAWSCQECLRNIFWHSLWINMSQQEQSPSTRLLKRQGDFNPCPPNSFRKIQA